MPDKTPNKRVVLMLGREIAAGMDYLHQQDIIYGGLDPYRYPVKPPSSEPLECRLCISQWDIVREGDDL